MSDPEVRDSTTESRKRKFKNDLPTKEEQLHLRETENLMKTNMLRLQVAEILNEISVNKRSTKLEKYIETLITAFSTMSNEIYKSVDENWLLENKIPLKLESYDRKPVKLSFIQPTTVEIIGSYAQNTCTKPFLNIDVAVSIPNECFDTRDTLNYIYHDKRHLYLAVLAHYLRGKSSVARDGSISFAFFKTDKSKFILTFEPPFDTKYKIRVIPIINHDVFNIGRLARSKNNIRPRAWLEALEAAEQQRDSKITVDKSLLELDPLSLAATPYYNLSILEDMAVIPQNAVIQQVTSNETYGSAIILLKVWLTQVGVRFGADSLDGHTASLLFAFLVHTKRMGPQMQPLQAFQACVKFLAETDLMMVALDFAADKTSSLYGLGLTSRGNDGQTAVLMHPIEGSSMNAFWRLSAAACQALREQARLALLRTQKGEVSRVFLQKQNFFEDYDITIRIPVSAFKKAIEGSEISSEDTVSWSTASRVAVDIITRGLGDRVAAVRSHSLAICDGFEYRGESKAKSIPYTAHVPCWPLSVKKPSGSSRLSAAMAVVVGVRLHADERGQQRHVDRGPAAEEDALLEQFRQLWGPLSQLRRFRDGTIVEAVVWPKEHVGNALVEHIAQYLITRHLLADSGGGSIDTVAIRSTSRVQAFLPGSPLISTGRTETCFDLSRKAIQALDKMRAVLTSEDLDLPLPVESLSASCAELRYTALVPPYPHPVVDGSKAALRENAGGTFTRILRALPVLVRLRKSAAWPLEKEAFLYTKDAMVIRISEKITEKLQWRSVVRKSANASDEDGSSCIDVFFRGYVFRLILALSFDDVTVSASTPSLLHPREIRISHGNGIHAVCSRYPPFPETVRLMMLWIHNHYYSGHLSQETVELLAASVFVEEAVSSPYVGLTKLLRRLVEFDWEDSPLVVDFALLQDGASPMTSADLLAVHRGFQSSRQKDGRHSPALYLVSSLDMIVRESYNKDSGKKEVVREYLPSSFSQTTPERVVLAKLRQSAALSLDLLSDWKRGGLDELLVSAMQEADVTRGWNVMLSLKRSMSYGSPRGQHTTLDLLEAEMRGSTAASLKVYSNVADAELAGRGMASMSADLGPHPLQALVVDRLREEFNHLALVFWSCTRADVIGLVWRPQSLLPAKFTVRDCRDRMVCLDGDKADGFTVVNVPGVLARMLAAAEGLIDSVEIC